MLGQGSGYGQHILHRRRTDVRCACRVFQREQGLQFHAVAGERAGFVKHHRIHMRQCFQRLYIPQQDTLARQVTGCGQHRSGCGQRQGTWTGDDQHRHRHHQGFARRLAPGPDSSQCGHHQHRQQKRFGDSVGQRGKTRFMQRRGLHQIHNRCIAGGFTQGSDLHAHRFTQIVGTGQHRVARAAF